MKHDIITLDFYEGDCTIYKNVDLSEYEGDTTDEQVDAFIFATVGSDVELEYMYDEAGIINIETINLEN